MASVSFMWSPASLWEEWQSSVLTAAVGWAALLLLVALQPPCTFTTLLCRVQQQGHIKRFFWFDAAASHPDAAPLERLQLSMVGVLTVASAAAVPVLIVQSFGARFFECKPHPCLPLFMFNSPPAGQVDDLHTIYPLQIWVSLRIWNGFLLHSRVCSLALLPGRY